MNKCGIYFKDYGEIYSPLSYLYYSQYAKALISKVPTQTLEETISQYCPQCLTKYDEDHQDSVCSSCFQCRDCYGVMLKLDSADSSDDGEELVVYMCTSCHQCRSYPSSVASLAKEESAYDTLMKKYLELEKRPHSELPLAPTKKRTNLQVAMNPVDTASTWTFNDMEALVSKRSEFDFHYNLLATECLESAVEESIKQPYQNFALRSKRAVRSRLKSGAESRRMHFLIQPKTLPLDGDSSLRMQKNKWWVMDSSAVHVLPNIQFYRLPEKLQLIHGDWSYVVLKILNPNGAECQLDVSLSAQAQFFRNCVDLGQNSFFRFDSECFRVVTSLTSPSNLTKLSSNSGQHGIPSEKVTILLDSFEEENLKEEIDENEIEKKLSRSSELSNAGSDDPEWKIVTKGNVAFVSIPIRRYSRVKEEVSQQSDGTILVPLEFNWVMQDVVLPVHLLLQV